MRRVGGRELQLQLLEHPIIYRNKLKDRELQTRKLFLDEILLRKIGGHDMEDPSPENLFLVCWRQDFSL